MPGEYDRNESEEAKLVQDRIQNNLEASRRSMKESLRVATETSSMAANTAEMLEKQGGQIRHCQAEMDSIENDMNISHRLLRGMTIFGTLSNKFRSHTKLVKTPTLHGAPLSEQQKEEEPPSSPKRSFSLGSLFGKSKKEEVVDEPIIPPPKRFDSPPEVLTERQKSIWKETDKDLDDLAGILDNIKQMAYAMNTEIKDQGKNIESLDASVDKNSDKLKTNTIKIRKLL